MTVLRRCLAAIGPAGFSFFACGAAAFLFCAFIGAPWPMATVIAFGYAIIAAAINSRGD